ncbi:5-(carboxyamino)imidazole ribonucleotide synthase [Granulicella tundricola]|uniref:N5-carboxyaminoimidazole ribonucleotide synthase n=1 Tax=Granulicella tundricola (strain ATCC BAA-1859 / DSM 23138 / MP5ACTX9) TaxID=1198114 RepID=E8X458_GRATM|nr:5-(carboxyamino)imidazole ribonucleotide synthase [Granulicella tundricola]ADW67118.1 phosphoribosylaminoimidazole carboxylase, ATPase subunit [Granulicella tundricola MP5ACTX9]
MKAGTPLLPGATIGIFGGGQLGRMMAMAARGMGYRILVLDPDPGCPARFIVDGCIEAGWDDSRGAAMLARGCDVVTLEIEQIGERSMASAATFCPVRPGGAMLAIIQDRIEQKNWLTKHGFPVGEFRAVRSLDETRAAIAELGRCFCKSATGGYDGRGQGKVGFSAEPVTEADVLGAWEALGEGPGVVEKAVHLEREISVMVARSPRGEVKVYPAAWNHHENQILDWSVIPAPIPPSMEAEAREIAYEIADTFQLEGLLAVEMFITQDGELLINELAPRPHNSYHESERACVTSQFEQAIRAVCDLPLGDVEVVQPAAIANLLGDLWLNPDGSAREVCFDKALAVPGVALHLYEKLKPRKGRKMGHLSAIGATAEQAIERVLRAKAAL